MAEEKSINQINYRIRSGKANVLTEVELHESIQKSRDLKWSDVDVVTTSFESSISGTAAMLIVPIAGRGVFKRANKVWLNNILCFPGPAPNERLGLADTLIFSDQRAQKLQGDYSGAELISDLIKREKIHVRCITNEGNTYERTFTIDEVEFARMYIYNLFFNKICSKMANPERINHLQTIREGSKILVNGVAGLVIGCGTRSEPENRSLSLAADMFEMDPPCLRRSEINGEMQMFNSVSFAIPILNEEIFLNLKKCFKEEATREFRSNVQTKEDMAVYLKKQISSGEFLLTSSDKKLDNWF